MTGEETILILIGILLGYFIKWAEVQSSKPSP